MRTNIWWLKLVVQMLRAKKKTPRSSRGAAGGAGFLLYNREILFDGQDLLHDEPTSVYQLFIHGYWCVHFEWTYSLVPARVYCNSGVGLGLLVRLEKSLLDRESSLLRVVCDKTRVGLDIVGEAKVFMAHFCTVITVTKPDTNTFFLFLVINVSWHIHDTQKKRREIRFVSLIFFFFVVEST